MDAKTKTNLLRAFAGECQARMRYEIAAKVAGKSGLPVLQDMLYFTANQEKEHAKYQCRNSGYQATIGRQPLHHGPPLPE